MTHRDSSLCPRPLAAAALAALALAACGDDNGTGPSDGGGDRAYVRVVNSAFQASAAATGANPFGCPCTPLSVDLLYDSATTAPSLVGMAPVSVGGGTAGPPPSNQNALYGPVAAGVRSFVARAAGGAAGGAGNPTFFTTAARTGYLPKQFLPAGIYHTFMIVGVNPAQPAAGPPVFAANTAFTTGPGTFPLVADDPFPPPSVPAAAGGQVLQARFRVVNAAPFSAGFTGLYVTPGSTPPPAAFYATTVATLIAGPRTASYYVNVTAGDYTVTFRDLFTGTIYSQTGVTFGSGEVRTFVLQNTVPAGVAAIPAGGPPAATAAQYYKLTNILDNKF